MSDKRGHNGSTFLDNGLTESDLAAQSAASFNRHDVVDAHHQAGNPVFDLTTNHPGHGGQDDLSVSPTDTTDLGSQLPVQDLNNGHDLSLGASESSNGFHAPPPVAPVYGQLWYGGQGADAGTSSGSSDNQIGHIDSDTAGRAVSDVDTQDNDSGFESIGLDTSAGMYFGLDGEGLLRSGHITNDTETNENSQFGTTIANQTGSELQLTDTTNADEDNAIAIDPVNHVIYTEIWGKDDDTTAIIKISYNTSTGVMTSPYNSSTGNLTAGSNVVATYNTTGGKLVDVTAMSFDIATGKLYYIDDDLGYNHNFGANQVWGPTKNIYSIDTTNANPSSTLTQLTTGLTATDANTYIAGFAVDEVKGIIYYGINNVSGHSTQIFWMPITGGAGTAMTIPGGVTLGFETYYSNGSNGMAIDQNSQTLYVANSTGSTGSTNGNIVQLTLSADGHSFVSGNGTFEVFDGNGNNGNDGALLFDNQAILGSMSATTTEALQGGSALTLLTGAPTITDKDDNHLGFFQVVVANAQSGDILSATASGGISVSFNSTTHTLTLSGDASFAAYQTVLNSVTFQDTGTDNSTGSHPTRTIDWIASDGTTLTDQTTADANEQATTVVIDRAPTLTSDNYSPVQESGSASGTSGTAGTGVLGNDTDKDADAIVITAVNASGANVGNSVAGTYGHLTLNSNGSFSYSADNTAAIDAAPNGSHPVDSFTYTVSDGLGGVSTTTVTFTINRAPTVVGDSGAAVESASGNGNVLTNDSDKDGDTLTVAQVNGSGANVGNSVAGTYGHITINSNGSYTYNADNTAAIDGAATGAHLTDTFTYQASDAHGGTTTTTITITLDRPPTVVADSGAAVESASGNGNVLTNDSDRDGDTLTVSAVNGSGANVGNSIAGTYGHMTINSNGTYTYNADNTTAINSAATGSHLTDTFSYTASDGHGGTTTTNIVITLDRPPTVVNDSGSDVESATLNVLAAGGVIANDSDRDGDSLTVTAVGGSGANVGNSFATTYGHITLNADGSYSYVADNTAAIDAAANGSHPIDTITITVSDGHGGTTNETLSITIDRAPTVVADSGAAVESASGTGNVLTNDSDKDGDTLTVSAVNGSGANVGNSVAGTYGHITINSNGSYTYNADNTAAIDGAATGSHLTDTFSYTASDGHGGTTTTNVIITLDRAPTVVADAGAALESASGNGNVLTNDSDRDGDTLVVSAVNGSGANVGNSVAGTYGHITINADGSYSYTADNTAAIDGAATGSHPTDTFSYTASDGHGGTTTTNIVITIDRAPTVVNDSGSDVEGATLNVLAASGVIANDSDRDGDTLTVTAVGGSGANVGNSFATTYGHITLNADGSYSYVADNTAAIDGAATGSHPIDTVSLTVSDGHGGTTNETLSITIDRAPTVVADSGAAVESASGTGNVLTNDSDNDGDTLVVSAVNGNAGNVGNSIAGTYGHITINADGSYTYNADNTSAIDGAATGSHLTDTFSYTASDGHGGTTTTNIVITLDRGPTVVNDTNSVAESGTVSDNAANGVLANDSDRDGDTLVVSAVNGNTNNVGFSIATTYGHITVNSDGSYSYTADNTSAIDGAATGSHPIDTVTITVSDGHGGTTNETLSLTIDRAAVANLDTLNTTENSTATVGSGSPVNANLLANDSDPDGDSIAITQVNGSGANVGTQITLASGALLTVNADGTYTYDPNHAFDWLPDFNSSGASNTTATDSFSYMIDGGAMTTVTITIKGVDSNDTLVGTSGNDTLNGGLGDDIIYDDNGLNSGKDPHDTSAGFSGGTDSFSGGSGNDTFYMGANLTAADHIDGGTNSDRVILNGNYSAGLTFTSTTMVNVENLGLVAGNSYNLTMANATVTSGNTLRLQAGTLGAGDNVTFDASNDTTGGNYVMNTGAGNDVLIGGIGNDRFRPGSGTDSITGNGGDDRIAMTSNLTAADSIDGGNGDDIVILKGDYSAGVVFGATTMVNVETLGLVKGFSYNLTLDGATDPSGDTLTVHAQSLQASNTVTLDGSAVAGDLVINTGDGNDVLTGGTGDDTFRPGSGVDTIHGGGGDDTINMTNAFTAADTIDGGTGTNKLLLDGFYSGVNAITFGATTVTNIQIIELAAGHDYSLTFNAATVGAGQSMTIRGDSLGVGDKMTIDASALGATSSVVIDAGGGPNTLIGGAGNDIIRGGFGVDHITGGGGADLIYGDGSNDVFIYNSASDSTSTTYDSIKDFDAMSDHFQIVGWAVNAINAEVTTGHLNAATFDTDLATAITGAQLGAHDAVVFDPNHGDLHNHLFLIVDMNGVAGYQAGQDLVIDITGASNIGSLTTANFMT